MISLQPPSSASSPQPVPTLVSVQIWDFSLAVRCALHPKLRGRPAAVVTSRRRQGRVLCCSEEARAAGIAAGMPTPLAEAVCPDLTVLLREPEQEARAMRALAEAAGRICPYVEAAGPGSLYLDLRGTGRLWGAPIDAAAALRREVRDLYVLDSAHGLSRRKTWSRLAGRLVAPGGVMEVLPGQEGFFLDLVPPEWVHGIGVQTLALLRDLNIRRLGQLRPYGRGELIDLFGSPGHALASAIDPDGDDTTVLPCGDQTAPAAVYETTVALPVESAQRETILRALQRAVTELGRTLRTDNRECGRLRLNIEYGDGREYAATAAMPRPSALDSTLSMTAEAALTRVWTRRVRLTKLRLRALQVREASGQMSLFEQPCDEAESRRLAALDRIRTRYGAGAIVTGNDLTDPP